MPDRNDEELFPSSRSEGGETTSSPASGRRPGPVSASAAASSLPSPRAAPQPSNTEGNALKGVPAEGGAEEDVEVPLSDLQRVAQLIKSRKAKNIILLLGAGISTSAGIPDFRSPETGLYANLQKLNLPFPEAVFELGYFRDNPKPFWTLAKELYPGKHFPTPTHYFLTLLHRHASLLRIFTQNIDTLETLAGVPPERIIEAHGSFASAHCLRCRKAASREYVLASGVRKGEVVRCNEQVRGKGKGVCGGLVKPDIVFFGEGLPDRFFDHLSELRKCDLLIVIGTSLQVHPFASLTDRVPATCPRLLINREAVGPFARIPNSRSYPARGGGVIGSSLADILAGKTSEKGSNTKQKKEGGEKEKEKKDMFWQGDADDGVWRLVQELGWEEELEQLVEAGGAELERKWKEAESSVEGGQAQSAAEKDAKKTAAEAEDEEEEEGLEEAINRQLKL